MTLKISLVDNDYVIRAKTDLLLNEEYDKFIEFLNEIDEELITGKTAHLEIEGPDKSTITFEISKL
jgi:succinate dehydrogenase flavin-adding protein (antitoxin of CptAB toxin-antitoxin module)